MEPYHQPYPHNVKSNAYQNSWNNLLYYSQPYRNVIGNVPCEDISGPPGCDATRLHWCTYTPAITVAQFIVGWVVTSVGHAYSITTSLSVLSKMYGSRQQGTLMSMTVVVGASSRAAGPFLVTYLYRVYGTYWTIGSSILTLLIALVIICLLYTSDAADE